MPNFKTTVLAILTFLMLVLYAALVGSIVFKAYQCGGNCADITQRTSIALNTVQSLVSALVISVLAITKPGHPLTAKFMGIPSPLVEKLAIAYVSTWLVVGGVAFVYGQFFMPETQIKTFSVLVDLGAAWFGLAIAAAYAFLGIEPKDEPGADPRPG